MGPDRKSKRSMDAYDRLPREVRDELKHMSPQPDTVDLLTICLRHGHNAALQVCKRIQEDFPR